MKSENITFEALKTRQRSVREAFSDAFGLRVHRAISWIKRAEQEPEDYDAAFLFYWIAFNSAYASEQDFLGEKTQFREFLQKLSDIDQDGRVYNAVWTRFSGSIRVFIENPYVFGPYWHFQNGVERYEDWEARFASSKTAFARAMSKQDTVVILSMLFDRLYVLRNQIMHGGATQMRVSSETT